MNFHIYHPSPPLADYVEMMWHWENYTSSHTKERILPVGLMELTFNLSGHDFVIDGRETSRTPIILVGTQTEHFVIDTSRPTTLLSVLFKSGVAQDVMGVSAKELLNQIVPLSDVWGCSDSLYNQLMSTVDVAERFRILETTLLTQLNHQRERHYAVEYALSALTAPVQQVSIADVQADVALSPPRFIQVFRDEVGFTPKLFSRLQRFHQVLDAVAGVDIVDWADLALRFGYYDQSHLINDFRKFAGISPTDYAPLSSAHNKNIPYLEKS